MKALQAFLLALLLGVATVGVTACDEIELDFPGSGPPGDGGGGDGGSGGGGGGGDAP